MKSDLITGFVELGAIDQLPFGSVSLLLDNDLAGDKVKPSGCIVVDKPQENVTDNLGLDETLTSCVVTRAMKKKLSDNNKNESVLDTDTDTNNNSIALADTFMSHDVDSSVSCNENLVESPVNGRQLRLDLKKGPELASLIKDVLLPSEIDKVSEGYYVENDILMRKWRTHDVPADAEWAVYHQVVLPKSYRNEVLNVAHEKPLRGHFGVHKNQKEILLAWNLERYS